MVCPQPCIGPLGGFGHLLLCLLRKLNMIGTVNSPAGVTVRNYAPRHREEVVLSNPFSALVVDCKIACRFEIALLCAFSEPLNCFSFIFARSISLRDINR